MLASPIELHGGNLIGGDVARAGAHTFHGVDPATGERLAPDFHEATPAEIDRALEAAFSAFSPFERRSPDDVARLLEAIAGELEALGPALIDRARRETGLPEARLFGELGRTCAQLRMFAALVREGSWVDARIDRAQPGRQPLPRPDLRRMLVPMGPVVVFGASNFPLAFSVCGGDTAAALAARNPVVVKAHPAHPGTSELAARAVFSALAGCGIPAGVFSLVHGTSPDVSLALVRHPLTRVVAFTGSLTAGRALFDAAAARPRPIPVFAEMGSINPVFVLPGALRERRDAIAEAYVQSVTLGAGQFCTNPGVAVGVGGADLDAFVTRAAALVTGSTPATMLHAGIAQRYQAGVTAWQGNEGVRLAGQAPAVPGSTSGAAAVFTTEAREFLARGHLREELFGPASLVVACESPERLEDVARALDGQLTVTLHATADDLREHEGLLRILREKAGRIVLNGFPTGVEVAPAMQHGGPYPATTDPRFTSVGTAAILRFVRPVCYQGFPSPDLPPELQDENPRKIWRLVDGEWTRDALTDGSRQSTVSSRQ